MTTPPPPVAASTAEWTERGDAFMDASRPDEAATSYARALALAADAGDRFNVALLAGNLGNLAIAAGEPAQACGHYAQAVAAYREVGDLPWVTMMLVSEGNALENLGRPGEALDRHREAEANAAAIGQRDWEGRAASSIGNVLARQDDFDLAAEAHARALRIGEAIGDAELVALAGRALGADLRSAAGQQEALAELMDSGTDAEAGARGWLDALAAWQKTDDAAAQCRCLARLVACRLGADRLAQAEDAAYEQLACAIRSHLPEQRTFALGQLGETLLRRGRYAIALRLLTYQLELARAGDGAAELEVEALDRLATAYLRLGRVEEAERCLQRLTALPQSADATAALRASRLDNCGRVAMARAQPADAEACFRGAVAGFAAEDGSAAALDSRVHLADLLQRRGDREGAIDLVAFVLDHAMQHPLAQAAAWLVLGRQAGADGDSETALRGFGQAAHLARQCGDSPQWAEALGFESEAKLGLSDLAGAEAAAMQAILVIEGQGVQLDDASGVRLFARQELPFRLLQRVLLASGRTDAALEAGERARTRALLQVLVRRQAAGRQVRDTKANLATIAFDVMMNRSGDVDGAAIVSADRVRRAVAVLALPKVEPEPKPWPRVADLQAIAADHGAGLLVFSYFPESSDDAVAIWLVQAGAVQYRPAPPRQPGEPPLVEEIEALVAALADAAAPIGALEARLRRLSARLVAPVETLLAPGQPLCIVPDGALFRVPFAALLDAAGTPLVARHPLFYAPSIEVLALSREAARLQAGKKAPAGPPLVVGAPSPVRLPAGLALAQPLPPLAYAAQEARDIAEELRASPPLLGPDATLTAVLARLPAASLVHFAAHAVLDDARPLASAVLLAAPAGSDGGGALTVAHLQALSLRASLVVLSACGTALGPVSGDGVAGFARAVLTAGAPTALVALWSLADAATWDLMTSFYRRLVHDGDDAAAALQAAMLEQREARPHPRDWAAMAIYGQASTKLAPSTSAP